MGEPTIGQFVELRARPWLVEGVEGQPDRSAIVSLSCIADDAQGERLQVLWDAEVAPSLSNLNSWAEVAKSGVDDARVFGGYLKTISWNTATAADKDLLQAPFRAGIRLDPYQLLPLRKALQLPRVNLMIGDDVGLGKTVEAGLVLRDSGGVSSSCWWQRRLSMTLQWKEELEAEIRPCLHDR